MNIYSSEKELRFEFESAEARQEFELWVRSTKNWMSSSEPQTESVSSSHTLKPLLPSDQKLANLEKSREEKRKKVQEMIDVGLRTREGLLPWWSKRPPKSV